MQRLKATAESADSEYREVSVRAMQSAVRGVCVKVMPSVPLSKQWARREC